MIRKLAVALSLLGACNAGLVHALGLGEADVQSALNQPLRAEIDLVNVNGLQVDEILPGLATREEFLRAGVDRVYFLSDIRFEVKPDENGDLVVVLTTTKPVREPYLNFLVEVIWPSGRLLREYALLLDPPVFTEAQPKPVAAAPVTRTPVQQTRQQRGDTVAMPAPRQQPSSVAVSSPAMGSAGDTYGPTNSRDTLWDIALKARPDRSVSPQQVMLAIQDLNPNAFIDNNINKLKAGQVLRLPTKEQIRQRSTAQAINQVIAQNEALLPPRTKSIASASTPASSASAAPASRSEDELKLVVAEGGSQGTNSASSGEAAMGSGTAADAEAQKKLALTLEKLDKATIENEELSGRVGDLEEQLQTLQRLLTLKNDQLAGLQEQMRASQMAAEMPAEGEEPMVEAGMETPAADMTAGMEEPSAEIQEPSAEMEEASADMQASMDMAESADETEDAKMAEAEASKPAAPAKPSQPEPKAPAAPAPQGNFLDMILSNPLYQALVGLGVIVLLGILWVISRSNAKKEEEYYQQSQDDSVPEAFEEEDEEGYIGEDESEEFDEEEDEGAYAESDAEESEDESASSGEQEDVIAEADVYIAYGRLDQAANILEEAISSNPVRTDYRLKLLEVYKESNDQDAFNKQFSELEAIQDADAIEAATQIRSEMLDSDLESLEDKEHELTEEFAGQESQDELEQQETAIEAEEQAIESEVDNSFDFDSVDDIDEVAEELDVDLSSDELDVDVDIDLDLEEPAENAEDAPIEFESATEDLDAELAEDEAADASALEIDDSMLEEAETALQEADDDIETPDLDADELDVELDDIDLSEELDAESEIDLPEDLSIPDELTELDEDAKEEAAETADASEAEAPVSNAEEDTVVSDDILEEAVDAIGDADDLEADLGENEDFDFLEGTDEASTKLDLARAYIDMGDIDGARDILEEVEKEGSDEQQAEAKDLLQSLEK